MIHRFLEILEEREPDVLYMIRRHIGGATRAITIGGNLAEPVTISPASEAPTTGLIQHPLFSPDASQVAYARAKSGAGPADWNRVRVVASDSLSSPVEVATNPTTGAATSPNGGTQIIGWTPDGTGVYWRGVKDNISQDSEIWLSAADGSGGTLIWTSTTIESVDWGFQPRLSPDGSMIAFWVDFDGDVGDRGLWVMDSDGTNVSHIYTAANGGGSYPDDFYGWSADSSRLVFMNSWQSTTPRRQFIRACDPDGTNLTVLYDRTTSGAGIEPEIQLSWGGKVWLPDESAIACRKFTHVTEPSYVIGTLAADGSETFTALSPERRVYDTMTGLDQNYGPNVWGNRIYFVEGQGDNGEKLVSTLFDGSDYRVDHDFRSVGAGGGPDFWWPDWAWNGWWERAQ